MKISIQIDASPQEVREFFGWPPLQPFQEELMQILQENMKKGVTGFDPLTLMQGLLPTQFQGVELMQKAFFDALKRSSTTYREGTETAGPEKA